MNFDKVFKKLAYSINNYAEILRINLLNAFCRPSLRMLNLPIVTRYRCSNCGNLFGIEYHSSTDIYYRCFGCGKVHKARKNRVLGRF